MILLQVQDTGAAEAVVHATQTVDKQSVIDLILSSGTTGVSIVFILLVLSIVSISIFIERFLSVGKAMSYDPGFVNGLKSSLTSGQVAEARRLCQTVNTPISRMLEKGISRLGSAPALIEGAMEATGSWKSPDWRKTWGI